MSEDKEFQEWLKRVAENSGAKIEQSDVFLSLMSKNYKENPQCALELGIALLLGKPIAIITVDGEPVPEQLAKLAFAVEHAKKGEVGTIETATKNILKRVNELQI